MSSKESERTQRLFVYGSLQRGGTNHAALAGAKFVREVRTRAQFALRVIAGYPALVPGALAISGQLFEIAAGALPALDEFEGEDYERRSITLEDGSLALAYLARVPTMGVPYSRARWP